MPTYNSDYMHCSQHSCKKKDRCYRYWLGEHCTGIASYYMPEEPISDGCEYFMDIKNW